MREKILRLIELTDNMSADANKIITTMTEQLRAGWKKFFDEALPEDIEQGRALLEQTLRSDSDTLRNRILEIYAENLTEEDLDAAIAHAEQLRSWASTAAGQRIASVVPLIAGAIVDAQNAWLKDRLITVEPELQRIFGSGEAPPAPTLEESAKIEAQNL